MAQFVDSDLGDAFAPGSDRRDSGLGDDGDDLAFREAEYLPRQWFVRQIRDFCERQSGFETVEQHASKAERLFDQLRYIPHETLKTWPVEVLIDGLVDAADDLAEDKGGREWGRPSIWHLMDKLLEQVQAAAPARYEAALASAFETGASMGFLTEIFRRETFGHGYFGDRPEPHQRLTTAGGYEAARVIMLKRYSELGLDGIQASRYAVDMLYAWAQGGARDDIMQKVAARATNETWFLSFLQSLYGPRSTLSRAAVETFFASPVAVFRQVHSLARNGNEQASDIVSSFLANNNADEDEIEAVFTDWEAATTPSQGAAEADTLFRTLSIICLSIILRVDFLSYGGSSSSTGAKAGGCKGAIGDWIETVVLAAKLPLRLPSRER